MSFENHGFDDIFKPPMFVECIELDVIKKNEDLSQRLIKEAIRFVKQKNLSDCGLQKPASFFIPKDRHTFRQVAWFHPEDVLKYTSIVLMLQSEIEAARLGKRSDIVHSYRMSETQPEVFDSSYGYSSFRNESRKRSASFLGGFKVITDISNFYDRVNLHSLENILHQIDCDPHTVRFINEVLIHFSNGSSSGLPVGCDASRILAEASLINVDKSLNKEGVNFVRYVDDFRIFAQSKSEAYKAILMLTKFLYREGLHINHLKTNVREIKEETLEPDSKAEISFEQHKSINESERVASFRITQSISGKSRISKHYKRPGREAIQRLKDLNISDKIDLFRNSEGVVQEEAIRDIVKYFLYVNKDMSLIEFLLKEKVTSIIYLADALIKDAEMLSACERDGVVSTILECVDPKTCPYPYVIPVIRVISSKQFLRADILESCLEKVTVGDSSIYLREIILLSFESIPRENLRLMCLDHFPRWPAEVQRALIHVVKKASHLLDGEKRVLVKSMRASSSDEIIKYI